ncbi:MAG: YraN family protein [Oscillospiraceae bacterium]|nr:YraN family protein [Oscillospiraceae bacterium]
MNGAEKKLIGRRGELLAAEYLKNKRYQIVGMNYSCRLGELDVIAENRDYVAFVEVKTRKNADFAKAREAVTPSKQRRLIAAAQLWLQQNPTDKQPRFDVIEVYTEEGPKPRFVHLENAFGTDW